MKLVMLFLLSFIFIEYLPAQKLHVVWINIRGDVQVISKSGGCKIYTNKFGLRYCEKWCIVTKRIAIIKKPSLRIEHDSVFSDLKAGYKFMDEFNQNYGQTPPADWGIYYIDWNTSAGEWMEEIKS